MKIQHVRIAALGFILIAGIVTTSLSAERFNNCIGCHRELGGEAVEALDKDIHAKNDLFCDGCHGGYSTIETDDPSVAMDPRKGFIGVPGAKEIPKLCGKCHSNASYMKKFNPNLSVDQLAEYRTSRHGILLQKGDRKVATCVSCHGAHGVTDPKDPTSPVYPLMVVETCGKCHANKEYMAEYEIPTDQVEEYKRSVHGKMLQEEGDISAPTCNDCHGNHGPVPPQAAAIGNVCGQCHMTNWEMFMKSPHKDAYAALDIPACEICHGNHEIARASDEMIGASGKSVCLQCHEEGSNGYRVSAGMSDALQSLAGTISRAQTLIRKAGAAGMEVVEASFDLKRAEEQLTKSRASIHTFDLDEVKREVGEGLASAQKGITGGEKALSELQFRRKGLALSLVFIAIVAVLLYLKIRSRKISG